MLSKIKCNDQNGVLDKAAATQRFSLPGAPAAPQLVSASMSDSTEKSGENHHQQYNYHWAVIAVVVLLVLFLLLVVVLVLVNQAHA